MVDSVPAEYPEPKWVEGEDGRVEIRVFVTAEGTPCGVEILKSDMVSFSSAARTAVFASRYSPARLEGNPTTGFLDKTYSFSFEKWAQANLRDSRPEMDLNPPLIGSQEGRVEFEGVEFVGWVSVRVYRSVESQVLPKLRKNEELLRVVHHLDFPERSRIDYLRQGDLSVQTCTQRREDGECSTGRVFNFINNAGNYEIYEKEGVEIVWH